MKEWERCPIEHGNPKKSEVAMLISELTDFRHITVTKDKGHYIYNDKGINSSKGYNNYKYLSTQL